MITSNANAQVKELALLQKRSRERKKRQVFVIEGLRMFRETPKDRIESIYVSESFVGNSRYKQLIKGLKYEALSDQVFRHVSDTNTPQGILCVVRMKESTPEELVKEGGLWLVLENIQDPGNLGTMFRTAEGAGVSGIIMDATTADVYAPKVIRSTMGSIYRVPFLILPDLEPALNRMKAKGISIYAAHLQGSVDYDLPDYKKGCAFLIGNEGNGLTEEIVAYADQNIRIPMEGELESLNAAVAASILMYEANRQRRK